MATHSNILAWRIPGTGDPVGLPSMGSHRVGHNWTDLAAAAAACMDTLEGYIPLIQYIREMFFKLFSFCSFIGGTGKKWRDIKELDYFCFQSSI